VKNARARAVKEFIPQREEHPATALEPVRHPARKDKFYKNLLCSNYMGSGLCPFKDRCTYAHGRYQLRPVGWKGNFSVKIHDNPEWKTSMCLFFLQEGAICMYGNETFKRTTKRNFKRNVKTKIRRNF
jgi:hypothetical protein